MQSKNLCIALFVFGCSLSVNGQNANQSIQNIKSQFTKGETTVSEILGNASLMTLHSLTPFREVVRGNAKAEKIKIVTDDEPGKKILVQGIITNRQEVPEAGKLIYVYQTSGKGWYADTAAHVAENEGDRKHARLFGYLKTNSKGEFAFNTIQPLGYPNSTLPAHIHFELTISEHENLITELLFDDDPRLTGETRTRSIQERFFISKNSGTVKEPVYFYKIITR